MITLQSLINHKLNLCSISAVTSVHDPIFAESIEWKFLPNFSSFGQTQSRITDSQSIATEAVIM